MVFHGINSASFRFHRTAYLISAVLLVVAVGGIFSLALGQNKFKKNKGTSVHIINNKANTGDLSGIEQTDLQKSELSEAIRKVFREDSGSGFAKSYKYVPVSCQSNLLSDQCQNDFDSVLVKECGGGKIDDPACIHVKSDALEYIGDRYCKPNPGSALCSCLKGKDLDAPICEEGFAEVLVPALAQECYKDPAQPVCGCLNEDNPVGCYGKTIGRQVSQGIVCSIDQAFKSSLGGFGLSGGVSDCGDYGSGGSGTGSVNLPSGCAANPGTEDCFKYFENNCPGKNYNFMCQAIHASYCVLNPQRPRCYQFCEQDALTENCVKFLGEYCKESVTDALCMEVLCSYAPQACGLCQQAPQFCEELLRRYVP